VPQNVIDWGGKSATRKLPPRQFEKELIKKVEEEAGALQKAKTRRELIEELGDVLDVIDEIKKVKKIKAAELKATRKRAFNKKGGFKEKLFLFWTTDTGYRSNEKRNK